MRRCLESNVPTEILTASVPVGLKYQTQGGLMLLRLLFLLLISLLWLHSASAQSDAASAQRVPASCPVTRQFQTSLFVPPFPYPATSFPNRFWFGSDRLWTSLPGDGIWTGFPRGAGSNRPYREKLFYWRAGYNARLEQQPPLTVTGTRLDAPAPPLVADEHANGGWNQPDQPFMVMGINLPTPGCWTIAARYQDDELSFVVWVDY